ncbi:MAG TPA: hypothetical protein PLN91_00885 [Rhodanobacteraceae bacterium]|nr:hypothetical protein [Rhodanobacteraceae bacterium]
MSPLASKTLLSAVLWCAAINVTAQTAAPPPGAPAAPAAAPPPAAPQEPVSVDPSAQGVEEAALALAALRRQSANESERLKLMEFQTQVADLAKKLGTVKAGTSDIPELVGLDGRAGHYRAEFLSNNAILSVIEGEWVTPEWRVDRILSNGVQLSRKGGKETHTILFGHQPIKGGASLLSNDRSPGPSVPPRSYPAGPASNYGTPVPMNGPTGR